MFLKHVLTFGSVSFSTRILNMLREASFASLFGASHYSDVFFYAVRIMSFFRSFFANGCVYGTLMPEISYEISKNKKKAANDVAKKFISNMWFITIGCLLLFEATISRIGPYVFGGYLGNPDKYNMLINFLRILMPYLFFIGSCTMYASVQNVLKRFWVQPSLRIIMETTLFCAMWLAYFLGYSSKNILYFMSFAWVLAGFFQAVYCYLCCYQSGFALVPQLFDWSKRQRAMLSRMFKIGVTSLNLHIAALGDMLLASHLPKGHLTYLFLADKLNIILIDFFGTSTSTVLMPDFAKYHDNHKKLMETLKNGIVTTLELVLPVALVAAFMSTTVIRIVYTHGYFNMDDCQNTGLALRLYSFGMPGIVLTRILMNFFYAQRITYIPIITVIFVLGFIFAGNYCFLQQYGFLSMAATNMCAAWVGVAIYSIFIIMKYPRMHLLESLWRPAVWVGFHGVLCAAMYCLFGVNPITNGICLNLFHLFAFSCIILVSYFSLGRKLNIIGRFMPKD